LPVNNPHSTIAVSLSYIRSCEPK